MRLSWSRQCRRLSAAAASVLTLAPAIAAAAADDQPVAAIGDQPLAIEGAEGSGTLPAFSSRPLLARWPGVTRLLVVLHGAGRDAQQAERQTLAAIGAAADRTLVVAPQFLSTMDAQHWTLPSDRLRWAGDAWADGDPAIGPAPISPFSALDSLLRSLADPGLLPDLQSITIAGQAEGADLLQRYALVTTHLDGVAARGVALRFVLAAPQHYLYFDAQRPEPGAADCAGVDRWPYGLDGAPSSLDERTPARLFAQYRVRDVVYLLGKTDRPPAASCAAAAQGPDAAARGRFYLAYLAKLAGAPVHHLAELPDAGGIAAWAAGGCGTAALLGQGDCAALAAAPAVPAFPAAAPPAPPAATPVATPEPVAPIAAFAAPAPISEPPPQPPPPEPADASGLPDPLRGADPLGPLLTRPPAPPAATPPR
jgi:hypothetical protein